MNADSTLITLFNGEIHILFILVIGRSNSFRVQFTFALTMPAMMIDSNWDFDYPRTATWLHDMWLNLYAPKGEFSVHCHFRKIFKQNIPIIFMEVYKKNLIIVKKIIITVFTLVVPNLSTLLQLF